MGRSSSADEAPGTDVAGVAGGGASAARAREIPQASSSSAKPAAADARAAVREKRD